MKGEVKFFNQMKNYGFIKGDDGQDYFVHGSGLAPSTVIDQGDRVEFDAEQTPKGPKAVNVKKE